MPRRAHPACHDPNLGTSATQDSLRVLDDPGLYAPPETGYKAGPVGLGLP